MPGVLLPATSDLTGRAPGVLSTLRDLATAEMRERAACGLVTGNVEGIARKKMRAVGVYATGARAG